MHFAQIIQIKLGKKETTSNAVCTPCQPEGCDPQQRSRRTMVIGPISRRGNGAFVRNLESLHTTDNLWDDGNSRE